MIYLNQTYYQFNKLHTHYSNEWKDCLRYVIVCNELIEEKLQIMISMFNFHY